MEDKRSVFTSEDYASEELLINPFKYKRSDNLVESIEDFAIRVKLGFFKKKETVYVRSLVRNELIKKGKRIEIFKKYLKENKKEFESNIGIQKTDNSKNKKKLSAIEFKKVSIGRLFISFLLVCLSLALTAVFFEQITSKIGLDILTNLTSKLQRYKETYRSYVIGGLIAVNLFPVWYFLYLIVFKVSNGKYAKIQMRKYREMDKYIATASKAIGRCYRRVLSYYKQNINRGNQSYEALALDELWNLVPKIDPKDAELEEKAQQNKRIVRRNKKYEGRCKLFVSLSLLLIIALLAFEIINIFI